MTKFTLSIEIGNDAMSTRKHVAAALNEVAGRVRVSNLSKAGGEEPIASGTIRDANGNTVGKWSIE